LAQRGVLATSNKDSRLHADELGDAYNTTLPDDLKTRFPSLSKIYEQISDRLHSATADAELFAKAANDIIEHFDARRLFKQDAEDERREANSISPEEMPKAKKMGARTGTGQA
jgi:hypothetical protein